MRKKKQDEETAYSSKQTGRKLRAAQRQCARGMASTASRSASRAAELSVGRQRGAVK
ncbi:hypothetical protein [Prevotella fusca]|uniref:hypothetical protein n=1 Tax=Prevotella fusca TaxID=589436 RepID=UPI000AC32FF5|nr:hypothetical protein [Prevotella fusca]